MTLRKLVVGLSMRFLISISWGGCRPPRTAPRTRGAAAPRTPCGGAGAAAPAFVGGSGGGGSPPGVLNKI